MKVFSKLFWSLLSTLLIFSAKGQTSSDFDLSTRWTGQAPPHVTPASAVQWIQNPAAFELEIVVSNFYAATNAFLEIDIGGQKRIFYGAGMDQLGNYIPTNYFPVEVDAALRRQYPVNIVCPNSGPQGSSLFQLNDFGYPDGTIQNLTNGTYAPAISTFIWSNFTATAKNIFTNGDASVDPTLESLRQTNLVIEMNRIISAMSLYTNALFAAYTNYDPIPSIMATNPTMEQIDYVNRLLLADSINFPYPNASPDNSGTAQINFYVQPPSEIAISKKQPAPQYSVLVSGQNTSLLDDGSAQVNLVNPGIGYVSTNYSVAQVLKAKNNHFAIGDGCDDPRPAPGTGKWLSMGAGCSPDTNRISIEWSVGLGRTFDGLAMGQLALHELGITRDTFTPYALYYNASSTNLYAEIGLVTNNIYNIVTNVSGDVYTNVDSVLRQVKAYQAFVDIITPDTNQTVLNFYFPAQVATNQDENGVYTNIAGAPFVSWTIQNPSPSTTNNLLIIENRQNILSTQTLAKAVSGGVVTWTLTQGDSPSARVETREVTFQGSPATNRVELDTISYAGGGQAYQCQETYHFYPWGSELVETRIPNNPDYVTSYSYYDNSNPDLTYDPEGFGNGKVNVITYPDGYWEKRVYEDLDWDDYYYSDFGVTIYGEGLLCYAFHPYLNGEEGGATTPSSAWFDNTIYTEYGYPNAPYGGYISGNPTDYGRVAITQDGLHRNSYGDISTLDNNESCSYGLTESEGSCVGSWSCKAGWGYDLFNVPCGNEDNSGFNCSVQYADQSAVGLAGHVFCNLYLNGAPDQFFYYDNGVYDSSSATFTINSTNHLYTTNYPNIYPDHRQTELDYATIDWLGHYDNDLEGFLTDFVDGFNWAGDICTNLEDHPFENIYYADNRIPFQNITLLPNRTIRNTGIFHDGNLVQSERLVYSGSDQWSQLYTIKYFCDSLGRATNIIRVDSASSQTQVLYTADYRGGGAFDGELLLSETDATGAKKSYMYDSLQRIKTITKTGYGSQPDQVYQYTYDANNTVVSATETAGSLSQTQTEAYDLAGRLTNEVDYSGIQTGITYSTDNRVIVTNMPGSVSNSYSQYLDRRQKDLRGNGCVPEFINYSTWLYDGYGIPLREKITALGHSASPRWRSSCFDADGMNVVQLKPLGANITNANATIYGYGGADRGLCEGEVDGNGTPYINYYYNVYGNVCMKCSNLPDNGFEEGFLYNLDRRSWTDESNTKISGNWYHVATNYVYLADGSDQQTIQSIHLEQLNGFTGNEIARVIDYDVDTNETVTTTYLDRANNKTNVVTSEPNTSSLNATNIYQNGLLISSSTLSVASPTFYFYDALARTNQTKNPLGYSAYVTYDPATGWVTSRTDFTGQTTTYQYYNTNEANAGKLKCRISATGRKTYYAYTTRGELYHTWGDVPYPAEYHYSEYGDLTNLITFRGGAGWAGSSWPASPGTGDNTYWIYDEASGALLQKIDASGRSVTYAYSTNTGQLLTRTWARTDGTDAVAVTNSYDGFSDMISQVYNDGTPDVYFNNYNRAGQPREIIDGSGTNELTYDFAGRLVCTTNIGGLLAGIAVTNHFNPYYGRDAVAVLGLSSPLEDDFAYETASGRLSSVGSGPFLAVYGYMPESDQLQTTTCSSNGVTILTTSRTWDYGIRLQSIANMMDGVPVTSHSYQYDALNRRTEATLEDGSFWQYGYDDRDELTSAKRNWSYFSTTTPVAGQQFSYAYDTIGNRQTAQFGGDTNGANLRTVDYAANSLNQYTTVTTPGYQEVIGAALATNNVTVNGSVADRRAEYFHREISVANTNQPVWQIVTNIAGTFTNQGGLVFPANSQALVYDADGNLSFDGVWNYQWDGENRLTTMTMTNVSGIANSNRLQLKFAYDGMGRRVQKIVSAWNGSSFTAQSTNRFVYDGWNLLAIINPSSSILQSFMWGNDLSGSMTKAGGVGGLLLANISGTNCFVTYDGNGNVTALVNTVDKSLAARYEYSPYGELIRGTGLLARQNPFRFSTKFWDDETQLIYYNARYYSPASGKWISRDSSGEKDNINIYGFVHNSPIFLFDGNGLSTADDDGSEVVDKILELVDYGRLALDAKENAEAIIEGIEKNPTRLTALAGGLATGVGALAALTVDYAPLDLLHDSIESETQEIEFDKNAQRILTDRLETKTANDEFAGLLVGIFAASINAAGGNGDDFILDASLDAAGTDGVDTAETIFGVATDIEDGD